MNLAAAAYSSQKHSHMPQSTSTACPFANDHAEGAEWWPDWEGIYHGN